VPELFALRPRAVTLLAMERQAVERWVAEYERAWRDEDVDAVAALFTDGAAYRVSPYEPSAVGHDAIRALWLDDAGRTFAMQADVIAVDDDVAVVRVDVRYATPTVQEYRDVWLLRFAADGRVADYEEWAYWPGKSYVAERADDT
jgi:ketosteroid isomerase-like protein